MQIICPMGGNMWKMLVKEGDEVTEGEEVAILESMKMEISIESEGDGVVKAVSVAEGDFVQEGDVILTLE
ncbi:acetyl-CoA carboxylase biotin carboxyl carrier protein subunit [Pueribacillus theae]|uniref:Acetyl-CoA carboxylase biotin carboxyl carrier protein subunit n=1 Tax=Pueribacillus theae TaxID=2171751 RepID=A0A2U1K5K6_9BACI|nr:acetyl-CoA carboxylase biotin carboxyl carrier protein subunit [Pueribacillus theae]PWA12797.1 acetyl-CoA carboxylase biotin carboxyl carrier protein subunit [Pueribacillus theae]